ncbi:MAG: hypothetical protein NZ937_04125 [Armatimonadetes bacterium]|nr:hypothetical protein [Armatimonadota bacterium]
MDVWADEIRICSKERQNLLTSYRKRIGVLPDSEVLSEVYD